MAKDRYGCTNRQKKLPIDDLGGIVCTNAKTISRQELEARVLDAIPTNLLTPGRTTSFQEEINRQVQKAAAASAKATETIEAKLDAIDSKQKLIAEQMTQRMLAGQMKIAAFDQMLDDLEKERARLALELEAATPISLTRKKSDKAGLHNPGDSIVVNPAMFQSVLDAMTTALKGAGDSNDTLAGYGQFVRSLVQKVVIAPSPDNRRADLTIHGRLASILASMEAFQDYSARMREHYHRDYSTRVKAGEFSDVKGKAYYLSRFQAILKEKEADWKRLQVSVVAGAGFEPAARLWGAPHCRPERAGMGTRAGKQKGRSTLAGSALILSDNEQFDDADTARIHFSGRTGIWTLSAGVSRGGSAVLHDNCP
ncbi:hypothetical protein E0H62_20025 [Rhizobium leguminosarum bv. viciae]|nr:hypothetical protein E0H62_20025 [Rhizobium leguminosarum bv. viciae]